MKYLLNEGVLVVRTERDTTSVELECAAPILRSILLLRIWMPNLELTEALPDRKELDVHWLLEHTIEVSYCICTSAMQLPCQIDYRINWRIK